MAVPAPEFGTFEDAVQAPPAEYRVKCRDCGHVWAPVLLPKRIEKFNRLIASAHCPRCASRAFSPAAHDDAGPALSPGRRPFRARCRDCGERFTVAWPPIPMPAFEALIINASCPACGAGPTRLDFRSENR